MPTTNPYTYTVPTDKNPGDRNNATDYNTESLANIKYLKFVTAEAYPGSRNFIQNSHMDIWQRGTSFTVASSTKTYCADRWMAYRSGTGGATVSRQTGPTGQQYAQRVQRDSGNSSTTAITLYQALDTADSYPLAGTVCQLKLNLKAGANFSAASSQVTVKVTYGTGTDQSPEASWTGTTDALSTTQAITTTATDYTFQDITIPSSATQVKISVAFTPVGTASTNDWFEIAAAQLTIGGTVGWERRRYQQELALCQRYFFAPAIYEYVGGVWSTTQIVMRVRFPVTMRTTPTAVYGSGTWTCDQTGIAPKTSTSTPNDYGITTTKAGFYQAGYTGATLYAHAEMSGIPSGTYYTAEL